MDRLTLELFRQRLKSTRDYMLCLSDLEKRGAFCALYDLIDALDLEEEYQEWKRAVLATVGISPDNLVNLCGVTWEQLEEAIRKVADMAKEEFE